MNNRIAEIHDCQAGQLIARLVAFLGENNVRQSLRRYEQSLKSSSPVFREYYLKDRHPWLQPLTLYFDLVAKAQSVHKHLTPDLRALAVDAKKVVEIMKIMPPSVQSKYRVDILDENTARNDLFEIETAWHFFSMGHAVTWYEDSSQKRPEFFVEAPGLSFNVECKWISTDIARKIHRKDFFVLADRLIPAIEKMGYMGKIDILLDGRLDSGTIGKLSAKVLEIGRGLQHWAGDITPFGAMVLDLTCATGSDVDVEARTKALLETNGDAAHVAVFCRSERGRPVDPIELTLRSKKADAVLDEVRQRITEAAQSQLDRSIPGLLACFLEGVDGFELTSLKSNSGLKSMTDSVLASDKRSHIAGVLYMSEAMVRARRGLQEFFGPALFFRNNKCAFDAARKFAFLSAPMI